MGKWKVCPYCNCEIPKECAFCPECGNKFPEWNEPVDKKPQGVFCTSCGTYNEAGARFCEECGAPLEIVPETDQKDWDQQDEWGMGEEPKRKTHVGLIVWIVVLVLGLGAAGIAGGLWWKSYQEEQKLAEREEDESDEEDLSEDQESSEDLEDEEPEEEEPEEEEPVEEEPEVYDVTEGGVHRYEYIVRDCTWEEAFADCKSRGGYMARINSKEEFEYILKEIDKKGYNKIQFFLGGKRTIDSKEYYWLDENGRPYGNKINDPSYWCQNEWLKNEPSFQDGSIQECCLNMFYYSKGGRWVWNDAPNDILSVVPSFSGKIGYVCEYE